MLNPQRALNSKFGPTYPPSSHPSYPDELVLAYPGVVFAFYKDGVVTPQPTVASTTKKGDQKSPLTRLVVSRHDPSVNHATAFPDIVKLEQFQVPHPVAEGDIDYADIEVSILHSSICANTFENLALSPLSRITAWGRFK